MRVIQFIYNNHVIAQQSADIFLNQVDELKWILADSFKCLPDEIETRYTTFDFNPSLSRYDVTTGGMICFNSTYPDIITSIACSVDENSDEFLDAIQGKNIDKFIENYLHFSF